MNQFYSEEEWEGYRKLGEHIAEKIWSVKGDGKMWTVDKGPDIGKPKLAPDMLAFK